MQTVKEVIQETNTARELKLKRIYYVWNYREWGGAQIYFFGLIREMRKIAEVTILLPANSDLQLIKFIEQLNVNYEFLNYASDVSRATGISRKLQRHWRKIRSEFEIFDYFRRLDLKSSIIHIEFAPWQSLLVLTYLCIRARVFITMHNSLPPVSKLRYLLWMLKFAVISRFSSFNIFPSNEDAKKSLLPLVSPDLYERTRVTYTNVDPDEVDEALQAPLDRTGLTEKFDLPADKFLVFCVGQFIDRKGRWTFLDAAKRLNEVDKEIAFVWISNSQPNESDPRIVAEYWLERDFILITSDKIGGEHIDLFKLMRLADVFVLASFQEGLPISLLEAMALGIPSISTNVNAIPEAVKHLETGWLIEAGDDKHLADAISALKADPDLRAKLSKNGREFVMAHFNEKVVAQIAFETYLKSFE